MAKYTQPTGWHGSPVNAVAFSPDGAYLLSSAKTSLSILWDSQTGQQIFEIGKAPARVVAFTPDGRYALLASGQKVRFWEIATREFSGEPFTNSTADVAAIAVSGDSLQALIGLENGTLMLFDLEQRKNVRQLGGWISKAHSGEIQALAFSPDGSRAMSCEYGANSVQVWDLVRGKSVRLLTFRGPGGSLVWYFRALAFNRDGLGYAARNDGTIFCLDVNTGKTVREIETHPENAEKHEVPSSCSLAVFSPSLERALMCFRRVGDLTGFAEVWNLSPQFQHGVFTLDANWGYVSALAISPDGSTAAAGFDDGRIRLFDLSD